tara:strand:- start:739 stop:1428 length:690 start_codon:yes stop_codon:yes gene_type:complete
MIKDKKNPMIDVEITDGNFDLYDFFLSIDDLNIKKTYQNSEEWFTKELPLEAIDEMYKRTTKPFKKNTNPVLKLKLPVIKNKIHCSLYNQAKVFIDIDQLKKGSEIVLIIHMRGLKILKQYFYCDCYVTQIKLFQEDTKYNILQNYVLLDDNEVIDMEYNGEFDDEIMDVIEGDKIREEESRKEEERIKEEELKREEECKKEEELKREKIKELEKLLQNTQTELSKLIN